MTSSVLSSTGCNFLPALGSGLTTPISDVYVLYGITSRMRLVPENAYTTSVLIMKGSIINASNMVTFVLNVADDGRRTESNYVNNHHKNICPT